MNILNNAKDPLKDKKGEKLIFIDSYLEDDMLKIVFKDNAGGIKENILPHIFEPYFTTKHKSQGTGLGLSMTHSLIEGMNGTIVANKTKFTYNEKEYYGTKFIISLPIN
jgi:C4-dicarboxylate-specific signal transduction histidine kinase